MKMKKTTYLLLLFSVLFISCERDINVNPNLDYSYSIADNALRAYLVEEEYIEVDELNKTINLTEKGENLRRLKLERLDIYSIEGLSIFENLSTLIIISSEIKEVKISEEFKKIDSVVLELVMNLDCLEVASESNISYLNIGGSNLSLLDLSGLTNLAKLGIASSPLTSLNLPEKSKITELTLINTYLKTLDLSKQYDLEELIAGGSFVELDLSKNTKMKNVYVPSNRLTSLNLPKTGLLIRIDCFDNQLSELDLSGNPSLFQLRCHDNQLNELDLSKNEDLEYLSCYNNHLSELDLKDKFLDESSYYDLYCGNQTDRETNASKKLELSLDQSCVPYWTEHLSKSTSNTNVILIKN